MMLKFVLLIGVSLGGINGQSREPPECYGKWTQWYNLDRPGGTGDWEFWVNIRDKPCPEPIAMHYLLSNGNVPPAHLFLEEQPNALGVVCRNRFGRPPYQYQKCQDLHIRFCCPVEPSCDMENYGWTDWQDIDTPSDSTGDYELLATMVALYPDEICEKPIAIDAKLKRDGRAWQLGGDHVTIEPDIGLICKHDDQPKEKCCEDYKVRFCCKLCMEDEGQEEDLEAEELLPLPQP